MKKASVTRLLKGKADIFLSQKEKSNMENPQDTLGAIVWSVMFGEDVEKLPDPNKPENSARINAMRHAKQEAFKSYFNGPGKPLFDEMRTKIRAMMFDLAVGAEDGCQCKTCSRLRELRFLVKMLSWAEATCGKGTPA